MKQLILFETEHRSGVLAAVRDYCKGRKQGRKDKRRSRQVARTRENSSYEPETKKIGASQSDY